MGRNDIDVYYDDKTSTLGKLKIVNYHGTLGSNSVGIIDFSFIEVSGVNLLVYTGGNGLENKGRLTGIYSLSDYSVHFNNDSYKEAD